MKVKTRLVKGVFIGCFFLSFQLQAQSTVLETNAPNLKWYQLNTENFRILYPEGFEVQAQRTANTLETVRGPESKSLGASPKKISVLLQNQSALSNGFVTVAPRRSEFYTMPSQNYNFMGTNDWLDQLAVHEYRHMVQFQRSLTGFNKFFYYLFGQQATAGFAFAAAPLWFWEGDAVAAETAFTGSGRGRIPNFDLLFRTNATEGRTFNYHKQYLRSYKHNIPDHYVLGYNMVSHLRKKTNDPLIWEKVVGRSWGAPFIPFTFSNALKKETGMYVTGLYRDMVAQRKKDYEEAVANLQFTEFERVNARKNSAYTDYLYPQVLADGRIVVTKSGIGDIEQLLVLSADGKQEKRYVQGITNEAGMLSASQQRVVWNEYRYDPRWLVHNYSVVKGYDFGTKTSKVFARHSRYSAAAISPDGLLIATIETSKDYAVRLVVLDYESDSVVQTIPAPSHDLLAMPRWTQDGKSILLLRTNDVGRTISMVDIATSTFTDLLPRSLENVGHPVAFGNYVLFNSPSGGIDNIHAVNVNSGRRHQITISRYGAYNPCVSVDGATLYYNDQTRDGMDLVRMPLDTTKWRPYVPTQASPNLSYQHLADQENNGDILSKVTDTAYASKRYHRATGMINPHSWGPYLANSLTQVNVGITSQDIMSTTRIDVGYTYDINERTGIWGAGISYQGFYPIIDVRVSQSDRKVDEGLVEVEVPPSTTPTIENLSFSWRERTLEAGLRIPLLTTSSKYLGSVEFSNRVGFSWVSEFSNSIDGGGRLLFPSNHQLLFRSYQDNGLLKYNHFGFSTYRLLKRSRRDINSKWGQELYLDYISTPYGGDFSGDQFSVTGYLYIPGLFKHHSIWGYAAYQGAYVDLDFSDGLDLTNYTFRNQIPLPRGVDIFRHQDFFSYSANYTLPIWYPDIAVGPLVNFQRIRGNAFVDYGYGQDVITSQGVTEVNVEQYLSVGGELKIDLNIMRFLPQFNVGFRYSYGPYQATSFFEVLIGTFNF